MKRRHLLLSPALLGVAGLPAATPLTLATSRGPVSLLLYVAESQGLFQQQGLALEIKDCESGKLCAQMLLDGKADLATAAELVLALRSFGHPDLLTLATLSASAHQIKLIARRSAGIAGPDQIVGRRVGTVVASSAEFFLERWLLFHALESADVVKLALPADRMAAALRSHEVDAVAIWEPYAGEALKALGDDGLELPNPAVYIQHFSLLAQRPLLNARAGDLGRLLKALLQAQRFVAEQPDEARRVLAQRLGLAEKDAGAQMREHDFRLRLDQSLINTLSAQARWALREGKVKSDQKPNSALLVEPSLLKSLAPSAVTIVR